MRKTKIIIDGSNIAFASRNHKKQPKFQNLKIILNFLETITKEFPVEFKIIIDASLRHQIDSKRNLEELEKVGKLIQTPCNHTADEFIIAYAQRHPEETIIISNDRFSEYNTKNLFLCNFVILFNEIIITPNLRQQFILNNKITERSLINVCKV